MKRMPKGLQPPGKALWRDSVAVFELSPPELVILEEACRVTDRLSRINQLIGETAVLTRGSTGQNLRPSPLYKIAAEAEKSLIDLVKALRLPDVGESEPALPQGVRSLPPPGVFSRGSA